VKSKFSGNGLFSDAKRSGFPKRKTGSFLSDKGKGMKTHTGED